VTKLTGWALTSYERVTKISRSHRVGLLMESGITSITTQAWGLTSLNSPSALLDTLSAVAGVTVNPESGGVVST
jgi:hypothetical protein